MEKILDFLDCESASMLARLDCMAQKDRVQAKRVAKNMIAFYSGFYATMLRTLLITMSKSGSKSSSRKSPLKLMNGQQGGAPPPDWEELESANGRKYYHCPHNDRTLWEEPPRSNTSCRGRGAAAPAPPPPSRGALVTAASAARTAVRGHSSDVVALRPLALGTLAEVQRKLGAAGSAGGAALAIQIAALERGLMKAVSTGNITALQHYTHELAKVAEKADQLRELQLPKKRIAYPAGGGAGMLAGLAIAKIAQGVTGGVIGGLVGAAGWGVGKGMDGLKWAVSGGGNFFTPDYSTTTATESVAAGAQGATDLIGAAVPSQLTFGYMLLMCIIGLALTMMLRFWLAKNYREERRVLTGLDKAPNTTRRLLLNNLPGSAGSSPVSANSPAGNLTPRRRQRAENLKFLGLPANATRKNMESRYKKLALKWHPDKTTNLSENVKKEYAKSWQKLQEVKARIDASPP